MTLIEVKDLHIGFTLLEGIVPTIHGVSFTIESQSTVGLVGESGSGKSVISYALLGLLPKTARITKGSILLYNDQGPRELVGLSDKEFRTVRGRNIAIIFQEPMTSLSPLHTIGDQIGEAVRLHRSVSVTEGRELSREMLRLVRFPDPESALDRYPFELSGGLRQRAMIAMALSCRPSLLIADEPTTALDVTIQAQILKLLKELQQELAMSVVIISHDLGVIANLAREVVVLYRGQVMEAGSIEDIFNRPQHPYLKSLLKAVPRFRMEPGERLVPLREIKYQDSPSLIAHFTRRQSTLNPGDWLMQVQGLSKSYRPKGGGKPRPAVDRAEFTVRYGECLGLVGESGCGKTTLGKMLMTALPSDSGSILFNLQGETLDLTRLTSETLKRFRTYLQFIFQDPFGSLNPRMTVFDIISEPLVIHEIGDASRRRDVVKELMTLVGLDVKHLSRYPHGFSGGQRQRIGIARALALGPMMLICDEPVSALDVSIQAQILNLLKDLQRKLSLTYLFISHNLAVVNYIADRIMVMYRGRIVESAPRALLFERPLHPYTRSLLLSVPEPNLEAPLDFKTLDLSETEERWPYPFTLSPEHQPDLIEVEEDHFVRAAALPSWI